MGFILSKKSDFARRVQNVMQALEENNVKIEFICDEFRISDTSDGAPESRQNMVLIDSEGSAVDVLPLQYDGEYNLKVFDT